LWLGSADKSERKFPRVPVEALLVRATVGVAVSKERGYVDSIMSRVPSETLKDREICDRTQLRYVNSVEESRSIRYSQLSVSPKLKPSHPSLRDS